MSLAAISFDIHYLPKAYESAKVLKERKQLSQGMHPSVSCRLDKGLLHLIQ